MQHQVAEVAAAGCQDVLMSSEKRVFHHDDHVTKISFGSLLVELQEELLGVVCLHLTLETMRKKGKRI